MFYVYIIKSKKYNNKLYIGFTSDLKRRFIEHNKGYSKFTRKYAPFELVYYEAYKSKKDAQIREKRLKMFKQGYRRIKERIKYSLIES